MLRAEGPLCVRRDSGAAGPLAAARALDRISIPALNLAPRAARENSTVRASGASRPPSAAVGAAVYSASMKGYRKSVAGSKVSLTARGVTQRSRFSDEPALSFVPLAREPPKGCWPTTAPVGLSFT